MKPAQFLRLKELLIEVADLPVNERTSYLEDACWEDPELLKEISSFLAREPAAPAILKTGGVIPTDLEVLTEVADMTGCTLSHFRIEEKITSCGMFIQSEATTQNRLQ
jgi:hypothetical protein